MPAEADDDPWFRPVWEDEPEDDAPLAESRLAPLPARLAQPDLLAPLAAASAALARLDARLEACEPALAEGLRARLALREAAGWLAHQYGAWVHPVDLGLREAGLTGSITAAAMSGRLRTALPSTLATGTNEAAASETPPAPMLAEDPAIAQALQFARLWRQLAEHRGWAPLAGPEAMHDLLARLGHHAPAEGELLAWQARFTGPALPQEAALPVLLRVGHAAQAWAEHEPRPGRAHLLPTAALFLAACVWRRLGSTPSLALPFWSATPARLEALGLLAGPAWLPAFLDTVSDATSRAGQELSRLQSAARRAAELGRTARSQLPAAATLALRQPVLTARGLADRLELSPQSALILLKHLVAAGVLREATGRAAWRAFVMA